MATGKRRFTEMKKAIIYLTFVAVSILWGCKTRTIYTPVESVKTEYADKIYRDSIYLRDSVLVQLKGDTVYFEKYRYLYKDKYVRDSVFITDSVQVPYPVQGPTEYVNRIYWWQRLLMALGAVALGFVGYKIYSFVRLL